MEYAKEGDQAALQSLTKIDQLIAKINGQKMNINLSQGMNEAAAAAQKSMEAISANTAAETRAIEAKAKLINAENRLAVAREKSPHSAKNRTADDSLRLRPFLVYR